MASDTETVATPPPVSDADLISVRAAAPLLKPLTDAQILSLARNLPLISTPSTALEGDLTDIFKGLTPEVGADQGWYLRHNGEDVEFSIIGTPRTTWAFTNGPAGNFTAAGWKDHPHQAPEGITIESKQFATQTSYTKIVKIKNTQWSTQIFPDQFDRRPRQFEYKVSCTPSSPNSAALVFSSTDAKLLALATEKKWVKAEASNGPENSMWFSCSRPVYTLKSLALDEGRESEYADHFGHLKLIGDPDIRYNRVPEVEVYNAETETYHPISFHHLHELGPGLVMVLTVKPRAYTSSIPSKESGPRKKRLNWDFRLINIKVMGKKADDILNSPSKHTLKRRLFVPKFDDNDDDGGSPTKQQRTA